jgi:hypothetical protein
VIGASSHKVDASSSDAFTSEGAGNVFYKQLLEMGMAGGGLTAAKDEQLEKARHQYGISWEQHHQILNELTNGIGVVRVLDSTREAPTSTPTPMATATSLVLTSARNASAEV